MVVTPTVGVPPPSLHGPPHFVPLLPMLFLVPMPPPPLPSTTSLVSPHMSLLIRPPPPPPPLHHRLPHPPRRHLHLPPHHRLPLHIPRSAPALMAEPSTSAPARLVLLKMCRFRSFPTPPHYLPSYLPIATPPPTTSLTPSSPSSHPALPLLPPQPPTPSPLTDTLKL